MDQRARANRVLLAAPSLPHTLQGGSGTHSKASLATEAQLSGPKLGQRPGQRRQAAAAPRWLALWLHSV